MKDPLHVGIIGATGLVGSHLLEFLKEDSRIGKIRVISRRALDIKHSKVEIKVVDFEDFEEYSAALKGCDCIFSAVGTTKKQAKGDLDAYRKVDHDIPLNAARIAAESGCRCFATVSSIGANSGSSNFYLKIKGDVEDKLHGIDIPSILVFRPSMLLGSRDEFRLGELIGKIFMVPLSFFLPKRMRPIQARDVARAMLNGALKSPQGYHVYHYNEIKKLSKLNTH